MGTEVQIENYLTEHCSMRDLTRESNGGSWPSFFGDNNLPNGQVYHGFLPRNGVSSHSWYDKDVVKQTMLEHEAIFKNQVYELHRLYRVQRELMDEFRRKEQFERQIPYETSSSSSPVASKLKPENVQRWNGSSLPFLANSVCCRPTSGVETVQSSPQSIKGKSVQGSLSPFQNRYSPKNSEVSDSRLTKPRRRMLDLQLPADEYLDTDEVEQLGDTGKSEFCGDVVRSDLRAGKLKELADLNVPLQEEETENSHSDVKYRNIPTNCSNSSKDVTQSSIRGGLNGISKNYRQDMFCYELESEQPNQGIHLEKKVASFLPAKVLLDQAKSGINLEKSDKSYTVSNYNVTEQMMGSSSHQCVSPWGKSMSVQTVSILAPVNLSKSPQSSSGQRNGLFDKNFNLNCIPGAVNGFHQESAATSFKEQPAAHFQSVGFDSSGKNVFKATPLFDVNLNVALPSDESNDHESPTRMEGKTGRRKVVFDMNLPCELSDSDMDNTAVEKEEGEIVEKKMNNESAILKNNFDLNSCVTDDENPCINTTGIDLEALIALEDEEPEKLPELPPNTAASDEEEAEVAKTAAEAIVAMSSSANIEDDSEDRLLHWLADIACLPEAELDDFECMTLGLKECTFEEYFPKPSVPEFPNIEEGSKHLLTSRTRKGPGRRGRQKRDFQRDILPGLTSLSRNEVTEDMQTFGGLMRSTGYSTWQCGPNRRNGGRRARGRPRAAAAVPAPVHTESEPVIINSSSSTRLEERSLTGWGKTTRRPRRQRLPPAANLTPLPPSLPLS